MIMVEQLKVVLVVAWMKVNDFILRVMWMMFCVILSNSEDHVSPATIALWKLHQSKLSVDQVIPTNIALWILHRSKLSQSIVNLSWLSISVDCWSQKIVDLSQLSISVNCRSQSMVDISQLSISINSRLSMSVDCEWHTIEIANWLREIWPQVAFWVNVQWKWSCLNRKWNCQNC